MGGDEGLVRAPGFASGDAKGFARAWCECEGARDVLGRLWRNDLFNLGADGFVAGLPGAQEICSFFLLEERKEDMFRADEVVSETQGFRAGVFEQVGRSQFGRGGNGGVAWIS